MKHYRIKVRDDKAAFLEELLRYLDFLDYEQVENFSEPRIYSNFELRSRKDQQNETSGQKTTVRKKDKISQEQSSSADSLREVLARIDQMRDQSRKSK